MSKIIIVGAGPAGLAAAREALFRDGQVTVLEKDAGVGGISKTLHRQGLRYDLGPHRFFTKNQTVEDLWEESLGRDFLSVDRLTRIFYDGQYFDYPLSPLNALFGLGLKRASACGLSWLAKQIRPTGEAETFEDWVSQQFGDRLYRIFFKTYTEKVWGIPCSEISADWARQRIKGMNLPKALWNAISFDTDESPKSLVNRFHYPRRGAGMMYERWAESIRRSGGGIHTGVEVTRIVHEGNRIQEVHAADRSTGGSRTESADHFLTSMPLTDVVQRMTPSPPPDVLEAADSLAYRSSVFANLRVRDTAELFPDNWIYVHSPDLRAGRVTNYTNFSSDMSEKTGLVPVTVEYFCTEGDHIWSSPDDDVLAAAAEEMCELGLIHAEDVVGGFVYRRARTYPVYQIGYKKHLGVLRRYTSRFANLHPIGRCGMFKYNNMDHSILTGILAARNIAQDASYDVWTVNAEREYHESERD
jgi:protoporphyrinogen oxidase